MIQCANKPLMATIQLSRPIGNNTLQQMYEFNEDAIIISVWSLPGSAAAESSELQIGGDEEGDRRWSYLVHVCGDVLVLNDDEKLI